MYHGIDPTPILEKAFAACERAESIDPNYAGTHINMGTSRWEMAWWQWKHDVDPSRALSLGRVALAKAAATDPNNAGAHQAMGDIEILASRWAADHGRSPIPQLDVARQEFDRAIKANADDADSMRGLSEMHRWRAAWKERQGEPVEDEIRQGLERAAEALRINPRLAAAAMQQGALELIRAKNVAGTARRQAADRARTALEQTLKLNANLESEVRPLLDEVGRIH
jgi:hypothetical protein